MTQFSEFHDASSKPWTQLSSFTALVFLLLTQNCSGLSQVVCPSQPVLATVGSDVLLSCRLEPAVDASNMSIEWSREDLDPSYVYVWWHIEELESSKHPDYEGRTSLLFSKLEFGNVSLKLSNVKLSDKGKYRCFIPTLGRGSAVELVVGTDPFPVISIAGLGSTSGSVELQCKSAGWYPEPELLWLDAEGNLLSAEPTETVRGPDGFYTVSSRVTVEKKHSNKFTCRVQQKNIKQSREALIQVPDDFFEVQSSNTWTIVGLTVAYGLFIVLFVCGITQNRKMKNLERTVQDLESNHSDISNQLQQVKQENEILKNQLQEEKQENEILKNQLQEEKQENQNLNSRLEKWMSEKEKLMYTKINLLDEKLKWMETERKLKTVVQNKIQELDQMNFDTNSDPTESDEKNLQEELEKQKWMETVGNLKTELQNMNKKLELIGPITLVEVDEWGYTISLKNISSEEIELGGWKLKLQINNREPAIYTSKESLKLQAGGILTLSRQVWSSDHPDGVDLEKWRLMKWRPEDKLQMNLISNKTEIFRLL